MKVLVLIIVAFGLTVFTINPAAANFFSYVNTTSINQEEMQEEEMQEEKEEKAKEEKKETEEEEEMQDEQKLNDVEDEIPEVMKYYREKYEAKYDYLFEEVWAAVKLALEQTNCMIIKESYTQNDEGLFKGSIHSDFCVHATGEDTTLAVLKRYSLKVPFIRGGVWVSARMQYKFVIKEQDDGSVRLLLKGEISGREDYVTEEVHFFKSNGYLETLMLERIRKNLEKGG